MDDAFAVEKQYMALLTLLQDRPDLRPRAAAGLKDLLVALCQNEVPTKAVESNGHGRDSNGQEHPKMPGAQLSEQAPVEVVTLLDTTDLPHIDAMDSSETNCPLTNISTEKLSKMGGIVGDVVSAKPRRRASMNRKLTVSEVMSHFGTDNSLMEEDEGATEGDTSSPRHARTKVLSNQDLFKMAFAKSAGNGGGEARAGPSPEGWDTVNRLKHGFATFRDKAETHCPTLFNNLRLVQRPKVMVVSCCDSRVSPNMMLQAQPGDIFTVRNVANLVPPYEGSIGRHHPDSGNHGTSAALEYAVCHLKVEHIIVMGHSRCGGIKALMESAENDDLSKGRYGMDFIPSWIKVALPARERTLRYCPDEKFEDKCRFCEKESVTVSLGNLLTFPWIKEGVNKGNLAIHGWYYDMDNFKLKTWDMKLFVSEVEEV